MEPEDVISALTDMAAGQIEAAFGIVGCIIATRIAIQVLRFWKLQARPLSVRAIVTKAAQSFNDQQGCAEGIPVSVRIGYPPVRRTRGHWPGHLVAVCEEAWLLDLSIQQANASPLNIGARPFYTAIGRGFIDRRETLTCPVGEGVVTYQSLPADISYTRMRDWRAAPGPRQAQLVQGLVGDIQRQLTLSA